jgi:nucleotide-binding universal stress UspA family protein
MPRSKPILFPVDYSPRCVGAISGARDLLRTSGALHDARCPVCTSAHSGDPGSEEHVPVRSIICAVDTKKEDIGVLHLAKCVAKDEAAQLRIVHAYPSISVRSEKYLDQELEHDLAESAWHEIKRMQQESGLEVPIIVEGGKVAEVVRNAVNRFDADLVIIGRGALHDTFGRLRTNVYSIIRVLDHPRLLKAGGKSISQALTSSYHAGGYPEPASMAGAAPS